MAEPLRSLWKGHLRLALVTIPVRLVSAIRSEERVALHQVHRPTHKRIRYQKIAPGVGPVKSEDIVSGYEVEPGAYVLIEEDEIERLKLRSRHTIELTQFVARDQIDPIHFDRPYYVLPDGEVADEGYRVIRLALENAERVGIGQLTMRGRENLVSLRPYHAGLLLETLRYAEELKPAEEVFSQIGEGALRGDLIKMATELVDQRTERFEPTRYHNHYNEALRRLVQEKQAGGAAVAVSSEDEERDNVVDLMEALRRSVGGGPAEPPRHARKQKRAPQPRRKPPRRAAR